MPIAMRCESCGASLRIPEGVTYVACGHCGTNHRVEREDGSVFLRREMEQMTQGVSAIDAKTGSLIQIAKLQTERAALAKVADAKSSPIALGALILFGGVMILGATGKGNAGTLVAVLAAAILVPWWANLPKIRALRRVREIDDEIRQL